MGAPSSNSPVTFAEFEAEPVGLRAREGMAVVRAGGKPRGNPPKLPDRQQGPGRMHGGGVFLIGDLAARFVASWPRPTVWSAGPSTATS